MSKKTIIMICMAVGMTLGGLVPMLWGGDMLGGWSILLGMIGGFVGIWLGAKVARNFG